MKTKILAVLMCAMLVSGGAVMMLGNAGAAKCGGESPEFSGTGSGTVADPYVITTAAQLQEINLDLGANYTLGNDIDASATAGWNSGKGFVPIGNATSPFIGSLDGCEYTITGLFIDRAVENYTSLIGYQGYGSKITNTSLAGIAVVGYHHVASLVGYAYGTIANCHAEGSVNGSFNIVGGLVGDTSGTTMISMCSTDVEIGAASAVYVGGLVGVNSGTVSDCYATGEVTGFEYLGGLIGYMNGQAINSYSTGIVNSGFDNFGGLIGGNTGTVTNCYWDTQTSGQAASAAGTGKTTAEMMQQATFAGWNFTATWDIKENFTYPFFTWQQFDSPVVAQDDDFTINEDSLILDEVTLNNGFGPDVDPDGGALTMTAMNGNAGAISISTMIPSGAWVTVWPNGTFRYIPAATHQSLAPGQWDIDTFTYTVRDANLTTDTATVSVNVTGANDAPVITGAGGSVDFNEDSPGIIIDSDISVSDVDSANLVLACINITANYQTAKDILEFTDTANIAGNYNSGSLVLTGMDTVANYRAAFRSIRFNNTAPNPTTAPRTITWWASDGLLFSIGATSTITVNGINDAPTAVNDTGATDEDSAFNTVNVTMNDTDPEADVLAVMAIDTAGTIGQATDNGNNTFSYNPNGQFEHLDGGDVAYDYFNYTISDGNGGTDIGMVTVTIDGVNDVPVLVAIGNRTLIEGTALAFNASASDLENGTMIYSLEAGAPTGASINPVTGSFAWTPAENQGPGFYNVTVRVTDDGTPNRFDNETIMITVGESNQAPVLAAIGNKAVNELSALAFTATATDADQPANGITYSLDAGAPAEAAINSTTGAFSWTPTEAQGPATYFVTIRATDNGTPAMDDLETIQITVGEVNSAPVLGAIGNKVISEMAAFAFTATATDADLPANTLTFSLDAGAPEGAAITAAGVFTWTPTEAQGPGNYSITVRVSDGTAEDLETFNIEVLDVNAAPVAADDAFTVDEDSGANALAVRANDADVDGDAFLVVAVTQGAHGTVSITGGGAGLSYTPDDDYFGIDTFTYRIADPDGANDTATVAVTITPENDDPVAADDTLTMDEDGGARTILVLANDGMGPDMGETLAITEVTQGAHGTVVIISTDRISYEPDDNYYGADTFTYTISDGNGGEATAAVTVSVASVNDAPAIGMGNLYEAVEGEEYSVDYSATDVDGDTLTWSLDTDADWLSIDAATGLLNGTAVAGTYGVQVSVSDGNGGSDTTYFVLTVEKLDSDNDGVPDESDDLPNDANETMDTDGDGIGDNADPDDDGDGVPDTGDAFPLDAAESVDTDHDGIGDNADTDDDGDGVPDADDPEPLNPAVTGNEYDPGMPLMPLLAVIGVIALIGLLGLAAVWLVTRR